MAQDRGGDQVELGVIKALEGSPGKISENQETPFLKSFILIGCSDARSHKIKKLWPLSAGYFGFRINGGGDSADGHGQGFRRRVFATFLNEALKNWGLDLGADHGGDVEFGFRRPEGFGEDDERVGSEVGGRDGEVRELQGQSVGEVAGAEGDDSVASWVVALEVGDEGLH